MPSATLPPTASDLSTDRDTWERGIWWRRGFLALVALVVVAGLFGVFGLRSRTVNADSSDGDVSLQVTYPQVARAGLSVPFEIEVHRRGGFDDDVVLQVSSDYLDLFDRSSVDPEPDQERSTESSVLWQFRQPPTDTFSVSVDMEVQKGKHWGRSGSVAVLDADGRTLARTTFTTWLAP
jgi:hypothetical protein